VKGVALAYLSVFGLVACAPQGTPPAVGAASGLTPTSYAGGTAANTTTAFDGTYRLSVERNMSRGSALPGSGEGSSIAPITQLHL